MENASKALIIAGAILVSILIIGLGMTLYNNAKSTADNASLSSVEVQQYNAEFTAYDGKTNIKGSNVKQLIKNIMTHNRTYGDDSSLWINVKDHIDAGLVDNEAEEAANVTEYNDAISSILSSVKQAKTYEVVCGYDKVTGYVTVVMIQENGKVNYGCFASPPV